MLGIAIDAVVLIFLLNIISDEDVSFGKAFVVALIAAIGTFALAIGLVVLMGIAGIFVAAIIAAVLLGFAVSALFGVEIKRSFLIAGIFMVVHIGVGFLFEWLLSP